MNGLDLKRGEVNFVLMKHDAGCPASETQVMGDCTCEAEFEVVNETRFVSEMKQTRQQRRAAARAAEKALRKARRQT